MADLNPPGSSPPKRFSGVWRRAHASGRLAEEIEFKNGKWNDRRATYYDDDNNRLRAEEFWKDDRLRVGTWRTWFNTPDHQLRSESTWNNGMVDGVATTWHENGEKASEKKYRRGTTLAWTKWDDSGQVEYVEHHKRGGSMFAEHFENGHLVKVDRYDGFDIVSIEHYRDGNMVRVEDPNAKPHFEGTVECIGVYRVNPTKESITEAAAYYGYGDLPDAEGQYKEDIPWPDLDGLCLVELRVTGALDVGDIEYKVRQSTQVPYLEFYLDAEGNDVTYQPSRDDAVAATFKSQKATFEAVIGETDTRVICFFLHFVEDGKKLTIADTSLRLPPPTELPERLRQCCHYIPVD